MKVIAAIAAVTLIGAVLLSGPADAAGCLKGAVVGGIAGHYAGHHGALGAGAGCLIGRHHANKKARQMNHNSGSGSSSSTADQTR